MNDQITIIEKHAFHEKHRLFIFITLSIIISLIIVVVSMEIYNGSGAAQLDLSRPGYVSVRSKASSDSSDFKVYSGNGDINISEIDNFTNLYDNLSQKVKSIDAFGGDPLSPAAMGWSVSEVD